MAGWSTNHIGDKQTPTGIILALCLMLAACVSSPTQPPLVEDAQTAPIEREPAADTENQAEEPPNSTAATDALLAAAKTAANSKDHGNAIVYLERAVRIDPRNAELWIQLSAAHLSNTNLAAATQHARKAIALAGQDLDLTRRAWLNLADIREAEGNLSEAKAIRRRYRSIPG